MNLESRHLSYYQNLSRQHEKNLNSRSANGIQGELSVYRKYAKNLIKFRNFLPKSYTYLNNEIARVQREIDLDKYLLQLDIEEKFLNRITIWTNYIPSDPTMPLQKRLNIEKARLRRLESARNMVDNLSGNEVFGENSVVTVIKRYIRKSIRNHKVNRIEPLEEINRGIKKYWKNKKTIRH